MSWECTERKKEGGAEAHIFEAQMRNVEAESKKYGKSLMMKIPLKTSERRKRTSVEKQLVQDCLQNQGHGMQSNHRKWEY